MKYQIGQKVWRATWQSRETSVICPDCGGTGRLRVIFHDENQVSIDCKNCGPGYEPPSGRIRLYVHEARASLETIVGCEIEGEKVEWRTNETYRVEEEKLFDTEEAAMIAARAMGAEADKEASDRIFLKEKDTRSWAWNASYHRREIKEAKRRIEYHTSKLAVAAIKAKEPA